MRSVRWNTTSPALVAVVILVSANSALAEIIDLTPPITSTGVVGTSSGSFQSFGQTFEVGADTILDSFTIFTDFHSGATSSKFRVYLMKWDSTANTLGKATGPVLFESDEIIESSPGSFPPEPLTERTFSPDITLESGSAYVIFLNSSASVGEFGFDSGASEIGFTSANAYSDGRIVLLANGSDFGAVTTDTWTSLPGILAFNDLSFRVVLTAIPEPSSLVLLVGSMLALVRRRRAW